MPRSAHCVHSFPRAGRPGPAPHLATRCGTTPTWDFHLLRAGSAGPVFPKAPGGGAVTRCSPHRPPKNKRLSGNVSADRPRPPQFHTVEPGGLPLPRPWLIGMRPPLETGVWLASLIGTRSLGSCVGPQPKRTTARGMEAEAGGGCSSRLRDPQGCRRHQELGERPEPTSSGGNHC